jgi:hypothetical protein
LKNLLKAPLRQLRRIPILDREVQRRLFPRDLRRLNDVLSDTPLAGRYWVWGGLLLGWARDGRLLDDWDADFAVRSEDERAFHEAVPALEQAGYRRLFRFRNNEGEVTEYCFLRHGIKFDFFLLFPGSKATERRYYEYGEVPGGWEELEGVLPVQPLEWFRFLDRQWLKPADHEQILTAHYGDWRTPDPDWSFLNDAAIVDRRPWQALDYTWD